MKPKAREDRRNQRHEAKYAHTVLLHVPAKAKRQRKKQAKKVTR